MSYTLSKNSRCAVIGHGSWATALVKVLSANEPSVEWYVRNEEVRESLHTQNRNCRYLSDVEFDMSRIHVSDNVNETINNADMVFLVIPAAYLKEYLSGLQVPLKDKFIVSAIKGVIPDTYQLVTDFLKQSYDLADNQLAFITGPTHAEEVAHGKLTYLTLVAEDMERAHIVGEKLETRFIHINYTSGMRSYEYVSCLKNIYAVLVGIAVGIGYGDNFIAVLVSNCSAEMLGFLYETYAQGIKGLNPSSFLGDLLVSSYSSHSRNRQLGQLIGRGNSVKTALNEMTMIAEGYFAAQFVTKLTATQRAKMPIADAVYRILHQNQPARMVMKGIEGILV